MTRFLRVRVLGHDVRVAVRTGTAPGPPLVLCNGIGASLDLLQPFVDMVDPRIEVVRFDVPGVGGSPTPKVPYNFAMLAWFVGTLVHRLGYDRFDALGISWGGGLAQQFAFQHPKRTGRLVLAATSAGMLMVPGDIGSISKMADPKRYIDPEFMRTNFEKLYGGETHGADGHIGRIMPPSRAGYLYQLIAMAGWTSVPFLPLIKAPTLVMMGDADRIVPLINGKFLAGLLPNAKLEIIPGGGHLFLVSKASIAAPKIRDFLDDVKQAAKPKRAAA